MRGFTLIELIIVMAIFVIIAGFSIPFIQSFQVSSDLRTHALAINRTLRRASQQSMSGQNNLPWGVYFDTVAKEMTLYQGSSHADRDTDFDQTSSFPIVSTMSNTFGDDINFAVYSGTPSVSGSVTINSANSGIFVISISSLGVIQIDE